MERNQQIYYPSKLRNQIYRSTWVFNTEFHVLSPSLQQLFVSIDFLGFLVPIFRKVPLTSHKTWIKTFHLAKSNVALELWCLSCYNVITTLRLRVLMICYVLYAPELLLGTKKRKNRKTSKRIRMHPNSCECIRAREKISQ